MAPPATQEKPLDQQFMERMIARVEEIAPLVQEHQRLSATIAAVQQVQNGDSPQPEAQAPQRRQASRPAASNSKAPKPDSRAEQVLNTVKENPGITVSEIGNKLGVAQKNYLYRVATELQEAKLVRKEGKGYVAV